MKKYISGIILLLILIFAFVLRVWKLDSIPVAISNDEVVRVYNAYSVWKTDGYGVDGRFLPISSSADGEDFSPVSLYLSAPFTYVFGLSLFFARIGYALIGVLSVFGIYLLGKQLFNTRIGLIAAFVLAVSPWHVLVSRGVWDAGVAMCLYIFAIYFFIKYVGSRKVFLSLPLFALALYAYHGTVIFFGLMLATLLLTYKEVLLKNKKETFLYIAMLGAILLPMVVAIFSGDLSRESVFFWNNEQTLADAEKRVSQERELSTAPAIFKGLFNNKMIYFIKEVSYNYFQAFSFDHLFIRGDINRINGYGNYFWGAMHLIELPFLLLGLYFVLRQKKKIKIVIFAGLLIAPLTSALILLDRTYLFRSIMMIPFLSLFTGAGLYYFFSKIVQHRKKSFFIALIIVSVLYAFFIAKFTYTYFYQYGIFGGEHLFKSSRDVAEYVAEHKSQYEQVYVVSPEYYFLLQYAFFNNINPEIMQKIWDEQYKTIDNVTFIDWCVSNEEFGDPDEKNGVLYIAPVTCVHNFDSLTSIQDSEVPLRTLWIIYER